MSEEAKQTNDDLMPMPTGWGDIEVSPCWPLRLLLALRLLGTGLEWGQLALPVPLGEEEVEEWVPGAPDCLKQGGFHVHEIGLVAVSWTTSVICR